jgi:glycosyltransferase involved in cell wall biosynthesis
VQKNLAYDPKKIAVIIPVYRAAGSIGRCVRSALAQELPDGFSLEVIVSDDCSGDDTLDAARAADDGSGRLIIVEGVVNTGPSGARNLALKQTDARWFTPLDSDDYYKPGRLMALLELAIKGEWSLLADDLEFSFEDAPDVITRRLWSDVDFGQKTLSLDYFVLQNTSEAAHRRELGYLKPLIDRAHFDFGVDVYSQDMRFQEDYELYTRMMADGARFFLTDPKGYVAVHRQGSLSYSQKAVDFERVVSADRRLLARETLSTAERRAVQMHLREAEAEGCWWRAIEAVRERKPLKFISAFFISPRASASLTMRLFKWAFRMDRRQES